jgi:hypothetical protein
MYSGPSLAPPVASIEPNEPVDETARRQRELAEWRKYLGTLEVANALTTEPVKARADCRTPEGLYGVWGNAAEIIRPSSRLTGFAGGSFRDERPAARKAYGGRSNAEAEKRDTVGFRVLLDVAARPDGPPAFRTR